jgi:hypothetical protein
MLLALYLFAEHTTSIYLDMLQLFVFLQIDGTCKQEEDFEIFIQHDCAHGLEGWLMLKEHGSRITGTEMRY